MRELAERMKGYGEEERGRAEGFIWRLTRLLIHGSRVEV